MKIRFLKLLSVFFVVTVFSMPNAVLGNENELPIGYCEMTISTKDVGFENGVRPNNYCEKVIVGYYAAGNFHISGATNAVVDYSGQKFNIGSPFSKNSYEVLTIRLVDADGNEVGDYIRFSGKTRLDTALEVSRQGWPNGLIHPERSVILARANDPADALAASGLSGVKIAPILLTYSSKLDLTVLDELNRLNPDKIYVLGGTAAISATVENDLENKGYTVTRLAGSSRFETAAKINEAVKSKNNTKAIIANGYTVADALSASAYSSKTGVPIYLSAKDRLPVSLPDTITSVDIYGGTAVISENVSTQLKSKGIKVTRISGANRYETSVAGAERVYAGPSSSIILVRGESTSSEKQDYPDAVVASALAHRFDGKIVLVHPTMMRQEVKNFIQNHPGRVYVLGGENAITADMLSDLGLE